ncbi:MAG: hypothetical protein Q4C20_11670 [Erysipelotrichaceae bacterium]|nr:hypothetical protein [Erysipelotrichaceae bacterium]
MGLFDNVKKTLAEKAGDVVKQAQNLAESAKDIDLSKSMKDLSKMGEDAFNGIVSGGAEIFDKAASAFAKKEEPNELLTPQAALKIIYYQMAADGRLDAKELEKFDEIGKDVDPEFDQHKDELLAVCDANISKETDSEYYIENLVDCIGEEVKNAQNSPEGIIHPKLLLWNLIVISETDEDYSEEEKRILRSVLRWLKIDKTVLMEMESTVQTLLAIEKEEEWLRHSDRPFAEVEKNINELAQRKSAIMQGVQALMLD